MKVHRDTVKNTKLPKGATHVRLTTADGKSHTCPAEDAGALEGCDGELACGAMVGAGSRKAFHPLSVQPQWWTPEGGTQAEAEAAQAAPAWRASKASGRLGQWLGHSPCSVLRALGAAGVKAKRAAAVAEASGVAFRPATVQLQVCAGRAGKLPPAPLTPEQLAGLLALAPEGGAE